MPCRAASCQVFFIKNYPKNKFVILAGNVGIIVGCLTALNQKTCHDPKNHHPPRGQSVAGP
jgi:hypothetical protein